MTMTLQELAERIDAASNQYDAKTLRTLIYECDMQLESATGEVSVDLHYFKANAYAGIVSSKIDESYAWSWEQDEAIAELLSLRQAVTEPEFDTVNYVRKFQIRTNLANRLNSLGRCVEAIEQWSLALRTLPKFAMAVGNRAYGICSYAQNLYDHGHRGIFLKFAEYGYETALSDDAFWDSGPEERVQAKFATDLAQVKAFLEAIEFDHSFDLDAFSLGDSLEEQTYREWCLKECLFLNPLNDITTANVAAQDILHLPSHVYSVGERPRFPTYYNHLKQEYVSARYRVYQSLNNLDGHFIDRDVLILDSADGGEFGHHIDQLKVAFRSAYALFDKIAIFVNDYFKVGIEARDVYFRRVWAESVKGSPKPQLRAVFKGSRNWPLRGLYYLSKDLFDSDFSEFAAPDAQELSKLRHRAEHRFLTLQHYDSGIADSDNHVYVTSDEFRAKTLRVVRMARSALIYLSLAMHREEAIRSDGEDEPLIMASKSSMPILRPWDID